MLVFPFSSQEDSSVLRIIKMSSSNLKSGFAFLAILITLIPFLVVYHHRNIMHPTQHENTSAFQISHSKVLQKVRAPLQNTIGGNKDNQDKDNKIFHYTPVSPEGTMKYQNEKGGEWHEAKDCRIISAFRPRVIICDNFITKEQAEELIALGTPHLQRSGVLANTNKNHEIRSSYGTRLPASNPLVKMIDRRLLSLTGMKGNLAERLYLLRYEKNQLYKEHGDAFSGIHGAMYKAARKKRYESWVKKMIEKKTQKKKKQHSKKKSNDDHAEEINDDDIEQEVRKELIEKYGEENPAKGLFADIQDGKEYTMTDRAVTTLLYLRGEKENSNSRKMIVGGNTSFPMLNRFGKPLLSDEVKEVKHRQKELKKRLKEILKNKQQNKNDQDQDEEDDSNNKSSIINQNKLFVENSCDPEEHFTVPPVVGRLLIFYDMKEDGSLDPRSSHAGCAVLGDEPKFTITKWMQVGLP